MAAGKVRSVGRVGPGVASPGVSSGGGGVSARICGPARVRPTAVLTTSIVAAGARNGQRAGEQPASAREWIAPILDLIALVPAAEAHDRYQMRARW